MSLFLCLRQPSSSIKRSGRLLLVLFVSDGASGVLQRAVPNVGVAHLCDSSSRVSSVACIPSNRLVS